jgi:Tfp pilus assembly PilM family ATPase
MSPPTKSSTRPRKPEPALAVLQFDATGMQLLRVRAEEGSFTLLSQAAAQGTWNDEDGSLAAQLQAFAAEHLHEGDKLYTVLPRYEITTRLLELPSQDDVEIEGMLHLSAEEHVPYGADELVIKHVRLHQTGPGESAVLAVFARHDVIDNHMALLEGAGLHPEQIFLSTACLIAAVKAGEPARRGAASGGEAPRPAVSPEDSTAFHAFSEEEVLGPRARTEAPARFALVHLATGGMEVLVFDNGRPVYVRGVSMQQGWPHNEAGVLASEDLVTEIRASLSAYRRESVDGMGVDYIFLSSDWRLPASLCDEISMETAKDCAPAEFLRSVVPAADTLPVALIGGVLAAAGNVERTALLLPERVRQARQLTGMRNQAVRIVSLAAIVLVLCGALYFQRVWQYRQYIKELKRQVRILEPQSEGVAEKQRQLNIISRQVNREGSVLDLVGAAAAALPESGINITKVAYERETGMDLWGRATDVDKVAEFASNLRAAGTGALALLSTAHRMYEDQATERDQAIVLYHVAAQLEETEGEGADFEESP